jgi:hypothetical protein
MIRAGVGLFRTVCNTVILLIISDITYFQQILKDLFMCARSIVGESDARTM